MKYSKWILLVLGTAKLSLAAALTPVSSTSLFIAQGFDDNDEVVVTLDGYLPNSCYQLAEAKVTKDAGRGVIYVQQMAYVTEGFCAQVIAPYTNTVRLGILPSRNYVVATEDGKFRRSLSVSRAPIPTQDDYLYAPVEHALVGKYNGHYVAVLEGRFTNSCLRMRAIPVTATGDSVQVLPIMEMRKTDDHGHACRRVETPFRFTQTLPALSPGRYLLHVRSLNGRSLNTVFSVE